MDSKSANRQLQAQVTVPADASTVNSVVLTATGSAAHLPKDPKATATVTITAAAETTTTPQPETTTPQPETTTAPLPVTGLPGIPTAGPTLSPGGNAAALFPTLQPSTDPSQERKASTRPVADTSALPEGAPVVGGQLIGLGALALAFVLAVTRLSVRRRPAPAQPAAPATAAAPPAAPAPAVAPPAAAQAGGPEPATAELPATETESDEAQTPDAPDDPPAESPDEN
jgi:hypothetical protein